MSCMALRYAGLSLAAALAAAPAAAQEITLDQAVETALRHTARGRAIRGGEEVAEQNYQARRINFYLPSVSLKGSLPSYARDQSYRFISGAGRRGLYQTRDAGLNSFIELRQSLITGGVLTMNANLSAERNRYPDVTAGADAFIDERSKRGFFNFNLEQPLLQPSIPRHELQNRRDDLELARLTRREEETRLAAEVIEAYLGVLEISLNEELAADRLEMTRLEAGIDSLKWRDGVISQEAWLTAASDHLDAELVRRDVTAEGSALRQQLALLLDRGPGEPVQPVVPDLAAVPPQDGARLRERWEESIAVRRAERENAKRIRAADFAAASHGLTGDLSAKYSVGRGKVRASGLDNNEINTNGWGVALNLSYPIWDGGASAAEVKAAHFDADRAKLSLEQARQQARVETANLADQVEVSFRRLEILSRQVELSKEKLAIAEGRLADGRISQVEFLAARISLGETRNKYLVELKTYLLNRNQLAGRFPA